MPKADNFVHSIRWPSRVFGSLLALFLFSPGYSPAQSCCPDAKSIISAYAGTGTQGYTGDGGPALTATLGYPVGDYVDPAGDLYICDQSNFVVRKVTPGGTITTIAGNGTYGYSGDGGAATSAQMKNPNQITGDAAGNLYICDGDVIRKISPSGIITTIAGTGTPGYSGDGGPATSAQLNAPFGIAVDGAGDIIFADRNNYVIRKITPAGIISTIAGTGMLGYSGDGGPATLAGLEAPEGLVIDPLGNIYFHDDNNLTNYSRIRKIDTAGIITTFAGNGTMGSSGDGGPATLAMVADIHAMAICGGNLYLGGGALIRVVDSCGLINTIAGNGTISATGDGGPASSSTVEFPSGLAFDSAGDLYLSDLGAARIRKIAPDCSPTPTPACAQSPTLTPTFTATPTPTATVPSTDVFYVDKNLFTPGTGRSVSIFVQYSQYPGKYDLSIFNTAGEHIKTLDHRDLSAPVTQSYLWDGKNKHGDPCASGVYIFNLIEPFAFKSKRMLLVR